MAAQNIRQSRRQSGGLSSSPFRPQDRTDVARFYNAVLAVGTWNPVARQISIAQGRTLAENAHAFALLNMAISDALASVMETKYHYRFWRPETAIKAGNEDGNVLTRANPNFTPLITTPCFPGYPSAHASASYAAREVLERIYGGTHHFVTLSTPALPAIVLQYRRLGSITDDMMTHACMEEFTFASIKRPARSRGGRSLPTFMRIRCVR